MGGSGNLECLPHGVRAGARKHRTGNKHTRNGIFHEKVVMASV